MKITTPKVFISYCWTSPEHAQWVLDLAHDLINSGIEVKLDRWDLKEGQDKYHFMEQMVNSKSIDKVLIILDRGYREKADSKIGGVGTETQIISSEIYNNVSQQKFIPIIAEKDNEEKPYQPAFIKNRIYIDMADNDLMAANFETLIRAICDKPEIKKPALGKLPYYIIEENEKDFKCYSKLKFFRSQLDKKPNSINFLVKEFLEFLLLDLKNLKINFHSIPKDTFQIGEKIKNNLDQYKSVLEIYIEFLDTLYRYSSSIFEIDCIISFLEEVYSLRCFDSSKSSYNYEKENFKFIGYVTFLSTIYVCLKNEKYDYLDEILNSDYWFNSIYRPNQSKQYDEFYEYFEVLEVYVKKRDNKDYYSGTAQYMTKEFLNFDIDLELFIEADLFCYYHSELKGLNWFPVTSVYKKSEYRLKSLFKLQSRRHFEKIKCVFEIENCEELKEKLRLQYETNQTVSSFQKRKFNINEITTIIPIDKICSSR